MDKSEEITPFSCGGQKRYSHPLSGPSPGTSKRYSQEWLEVGWETKESPPPWSPEEEQPAPCERL